MGAALAILATSLTVAPTPSASALGLRPAYALPVASVAPAPSRRPAAPRASGERLLELWVDGRNRGVVARVVEKDGQLFVSNADLAAAGLGGGSATDGMSALATVGVKDAKIVPATQQLLLTTQAGPDRQVLDLRGAASFVSPRSDTGFVLRYDLSGLAGEQFGGWSAGAALAASIFTPKGRLDATGWMRASEEVSRFTRLETAIELNDAQRMRRITLGDSLSSQLTWSRSMRFAGVQVARDFSLQPDLVTLPAVDFLGEATAPSSVDLFVNAARVYTARVEPGPFEVRDIPVVTGRGEAVVVTRDVLGRAVSTTMPLYGSSDLLAEGLMDYSIEAGALRQDYGLESFAYGAPMASASLRRGLSDRLTVQGHAEVSPRTSVAGGGATFLLGTVGVGAASLAASAGDGGGGLLYAASFESEFEHMRLFGAAMATSGDFRDIAAAYEDVATPDLRLQVGATFDVGRRGGLGASWISERGDRRRIELAALSYTYTLPGGWYFGASGLYEADASDWAGQVFLRVPLTGAHSATASASMAGDGVASSYTLSRRADPDGGVGYAITAAPDDRRLQAEGVWFGSKASGSAALLSDDGAVAGRVLASGALVGMDGAVFASRGADGALALVKTGSPGVQVYRENRPVAVTDQNGRALLAGLEPNARNRIAIRITDLPFTAELEDPQREVAPQRRSGVIVDFTPPKSRPVLLVIRLADGNHPAPGALLSLDGGERLVVGRRGEAFIRNLTGPVGGSVIYGERTCRIAAPALPANADDTIPRVEAVCTEAGS